MKKFVLFFLMFILILPVNVFASDNETSFSLSSGTLYEYFEDGSYLVTCLEIDDYSAILNRSSANYTVSGSKIVSYYDGDDNLDWKITLKGEFLIVPSNSLDSGFCQKATFTYNIYDSSWHIYNIVEQEITNNAWGSCTMKRKFLGITTKTVDVEIAVTCDYAGNLS